LLGGDEDMVSAALRYLVEGVDVYPVWVGNDEQRMIQEAMRKNQREKAGWEMMLTT
jgi:hypothetical protein